MPRVRQCVPSRTSRSKPCPTNTRFRHAAALLGALTAITLSHAADTETSPAKNAASTDYVAGQQAVEAKQWKAAVDAFTRATLQDPKNADAGTCWATPAAGRRLQAAFAAYERRWRLTRIIAAPTAIAALPTCGPMTLPKRAPNSPPRMVSAGRTAREYKLLAGQSRSTNRSSPLNADRDWFRSRST